MVKKAERQFAVPSMAAKSALLLDLEIITAEGNTVAAQAPLVEFLAAHPELKMHLTEQYKQLL